MLPAELIGIDREERPAGDVIGAKIDHVSFALVGVQGKIFEGVAEFGVDLSPDKREVAFGFETCEELIRPHTLDALSDGVGRNFSHEDMAEKGAYAQFGATTNGRTFGFR